MTATNALPTSPTAAPPAVEDYREAPLEDQIAALEAAIKRIEGWDRKDQRSNPTFVRLSHHRLHSAVHRLKTLRMEELDRSRSSSLR